MRNALGKIINKLKKLPQKAGKIDWPVMREHYGMSYSRMLAVMARVPYAERKVPVFSRQGPEHPAWQGGSVNYAKRVYKKDYCEQCGKKEGRLDLHHRDQDRSNNDPSNLITLCPSCHNTEHWKLRRGS